jgi:tellurite resistance protein TerC
MRALLFLIITVPAAAQRASVPPVPRLVPPVASVALAPGVVPSLRPAPVVPSVAASPALAPLMAPLSAPNAAPAAALSAPHASPAAPELHRLADALAVVPPAAPEAARPALDASFDAAGLPAAADAPLPEFVAAPAPRLLDRRGFADSLGSGRLSFGAELRSPNPVSIATLARDPRVSAVFVDASAAPRGRVSALVAAAGRGSAAVVGRFRSAGDPGLKPRLDEGLLGATLENPKSLKETLRFLRRLYTPPLGERSVGPSDVTEWLDAVPEFTAKNNAAFSGGVTIGDSASAAAIGSIVKAKSRGLRFVEVDARGLSPAELAAVETAVREAGLPLVGRAAGRAEAEALAARGYAHALVADEESAVDSAFAAFDDVAAPAEAGWLRSGRPGHVSFLMSPDPVLARHLAARSDAVLLDGESGHFTPEAVAEVVRALPAGFPVLVRLSGVDDPALAGYLKAGAAGLVAPQVANAREAKDFVAAVAAAKPGASAVAMLESRRGLANAESIAAVPGLAAVFVGPYDLSLSIGAPSETPEFKAAVARIEAAARAAGVPLGGLAKTRSQADALGERGYGFVLGVADQPALAARLRSALAPAPAAVALAAPGSGPTDKEFRRARNLFLAIVAAVVSLGSAGFGLHYGLEGAAQYLTTYGVELALSIDNLMAFTLILSQLGLSGAAARKTLGWGLFGALIMHVIASTLGLKLLTSLPFAIPLGGAVLLLLGVKMLLKSGEDDGHGDPRLTNFLQNKLKLSALWAGILAVSFVNLIFALDSIPTALGITQHLPIIIAANVASVLGLSQLYVLLQKLVGRFALVPKGVGLSLVFIGLKMVLESFLHFHLSPFISLAVIASLIGGAAYLSGRPKKA